MFSVGFLGSGALAGAVSIALETRKAGPEPQEAELQEAGL